MFYECNVAVLQAEILQKNEEKEHEVELFKFLKKELLFFFFKGTEIKLEFLYIYTAMEIYFHLGTPCNAAFIKIISNKCHNLRITEDNGLELISFLFFSYCSCLSSCQLCSLKKRV